MGRTGRQTDRGKSRYVPLTSEAAPTTRRPDSLTLAQPRWRSVQKRVCLASGSSHWDVPKNACVSRQCHSRRAPQKGRRLGWVSEDGGLGSPKEREKGKREEGRGKEQRARGKRVGHWDDVLWLGLTCQSTPRRAFRGFCICQ